MNSVIAWVLAFRSSNFERGVTATEYALIVSGVAVIVLFGVQVFGSLLTNRWQTLLTPMGL